MLYPHDLISCPETLLLCCTVLLNTGDKDADIISSRQPQTHTVTFLETHHHRVRPALWKHGNNSWQRKSLFMTETTKLASCFWVNLSLSNSIKTNKQQLTNTDPYISRSSALGFSGTLGGAWTFGATLAAGTAETKSFTVSIQFNCLIWLLFFTVLYIQGEIMFTWWCLGAWLLPLCVQSSLIFNVSVGTSEWGRHGTHFCQPARRFLSSNIPNFWKV